MNKSGEWVKYKDLTGGYPQEYVEKLLGINKALADRRGVLFILLLTSILMNFSLLLLS